MIGKLWRYASYRNFSKSVVWRDVVKKPTETPAPTESSSQGFEMVRMPSDFEKKILVWAGRFKSIEEVPKHVTPAMLDRAKSKLRIKVGNIMMVCVFIVCGGIIYEGKTRRKEQIKVWQEEQKAKEAEKQKVDAASA